MVRGAQRLGSDRSGCVHRDDGDGIRLSHAQARLSPLGQLRPRGRGRHAGGDGARRGQAPRRSRAGRSSRGRRCARRPRARALPPSGEQGPPAQRACVEGGVLEAGGRALAAPPGARPRAPRKPGTPLPAARAAAARSQQVARRRRAAARGAHGRAFVPGTGTARGPRGPAPGPQLRGAGFPAAGEGTPHRGAAARPRRHRWRGLRGRICSLTHRVPRQARSALRPDVRRVRGGARTTH
jgi:hypothetical protein